MDHRSAEEIFREAMDLPPEERAAFVDRACKNRPQLLETVASLLTAQEASGDRLPIADSDPPSPTARTIGRYEILEEIGQGGMGIVYLAYDRPEARVVALKLLPEAFCADEERVTRFRREARLLSQIDHPNVAAVHSLEDEGGRLFLTTQRVQGSSLRAELQAGPFGFTRFLRVTEQIAEGLRAVHAAGLVHRDLKPSNVLLESDDRVKIVDFGLAKPVRSSLPSESPPDEHAQSIPASALLGTPGYMSPEQIRGLEVHEDADVWAFGCIAFELLTGEPAFPASPTPASITRTLDAVPNWDLLPTDTPDWLRQMLSGCLTKDRVERIGSVEVIRETLRDRSTSVRRGSSSESATYATPRGYPGTESLPTHTADRVGREATLDAIRHRLRSNPGILLTLVGPPGCGKSRLATEAARQLAEEFPGGIGFCRADAKGFDTPDPADPNAVQEAALLLIDGCEARIEEVSEFATAVLSTSPNLTVLATSEEPLAIDGETVFRIFGLTLPSTSPGASALDSDAVRLFVQQCGVSPQNTSAEDLNAIARTCRLTDGLPLFLQSAAQLSRSLPIQEIARHPEQLAWRMAVPLKKTLERLSERERELLRSLSRLPESWTLEEAEAHCQAAASPTLSGETRSGLSLFEILTGLVDKSLILSDYDVDDRPTTYRLLRPVRLFLRSVEASATDGFQQGTP